MISLEEALTLIEDHVNCATARKVPLMEALGSILAEDIKSPIDMPPFAQSAMDGYAVNYDESIVDYQVIGEIQAGSGELFELKAGEAVRIFTGAAVPDTATTVVRQEDVIQDGSKLTFSAITQGINIRPKAEQIKLGDIAMEAGGELNPAAIGFIATLGMSEVATYPRPKIAVLTTGNELVKPGISLEHGKIYESNSMMLEAAFRFYGFRDLTQVYVPDVYEQTVSSIQAALTSSDIVVLSGGISVGDYDFVGKALTELGVNEIIYKVKQKPGKPFYFGKLGEKLIFALPGNPAAALTCFYLYILPTLNKMTGGDFEGCAKTELPIGSAYTRKAKRTEILKAFATDMEVEILDAQSSAMLSSFSRANALVIIPEDVEKVDKGDFVFTLLL